MKTRTDLLILLVLLAPPWGRAQITSKVAHVTLDSRAVIRIPVALDRVTTLVFPVPPAGIEGAFISREPLPPVRFQLAFEAGSAYCSLRALATNVTANLNVVLGREVYPIELFESRQPAYVVAFVRAAPSLSPPTQVAPSPSPPAPSASTQAPVQSAAPLQPARLPATIETARNYAQLRAENPETVKAIQYARLDLASLEFPYWACIEEAFWFNREEKLVVRVAVRNLADAPLELLPAESGVRVGLQSYYAAVFEGASPIPARGTGIVYLLISPSEDDSRTHFALTNQFRVFLGHRQAASHSGPRPSLAAPPAPASPPPAVEPAAQVPAPAATSNAVMDEVKPVSPEPVRYLDRSGAWQLRRGSNGLQVVHLPNGRITFKHQPKVTSR